MDLINALVAVALVLDFVIGAAIGIFVTVCAAVRSEDRRYSLWGKPQDAALAGTRRLVGLGIRGTGPRSLPSAPRPPFGNGPYDQGWGPGQ